MGDTWRKTPYKKKKSVGKSKSRKKSRNNEKAELKKAKE
jgi:hypothetical protein